MKQNSYCDYELFTSFREMLMEALAFWRPEPQLLVTDCDTEPGDWLEEYDGIVFFAVEEAVAHCRNRAACLFRRMDCATLENVDEELRLDPITLTQDPETPTIHRVGSPDRGSIFRFYTEPLSIPYDARHRFHDGWSQRYGDSLWLLLGRIHALLKHSDGLPQSAPFPPRRNVFLARAAGLWARQVRSKLHGLDLGFADSTAQGNPHRLGGLSVA